MDRWDRFGLRLAWEASLQSKDPSTKVGAYISDHLHRPVSLGFNGFPRGIRDDERLDVREVKYKIIVHAELNAVLNANRELDGCTIYGYPFTPCTNCTSALIQKGISRVVAVNTVVDRWSADFNLAIGLLRDAGVDILLVEPAEFRQVLLTDLPLL